jgi:hypothetical protein
VVFAEELFLDVKKDILKNKGVADYRFIPYHGAAVFQETLQTFVDEGKISGNVVLTSSTPEGQLAMAILMPAAAFPVVRGWG